ncbi:hypothetical protein [Methylobacterium sp. 285MFTsu5.1]|uniref:hypothetical protein n=1 Tax=Methylobacterium sp. 285MFTsu5.1 TaxID=1172187 RepID=UPI001FDAB892|nr:hypothetical protein [Methylobacterium sp. 285MFTsu5.1]
MTDAGFDASVLSEFRSRVAAGGTEALLYDTLLTGGPQPQPPRLRHRGLTGSPERSGALQTGPAAASYRFELDEALRPSHHRLPYPARPDGAPRVR